MSPSAGEVRQVSGVQESALDYPQLTDVEIADETAFPPLDAGNVLGVMSHECESDDVVDERITSITVAYDHAVNEDFARTNPHATLAVNDVYVPLLAIDAPPKPTIETPMHLCAWAATSGVRCMGCPHATLHHEMYLGDGKFCGHFVYCSVIGVETMCTDTTPEPFTPRLTPTDNKHSGGASVRKSVVWGDEL